MEMFSCEWPEPGGACWEITKMEPCCGDPCNPADGAFCCLCWYFCGWCSFAKYYASSLDQECALINHCLLVCCNVWGVCSIIARHNVRAKVGAGPDPDDTMGWVGDCVMVWFCCPCAFCQELRAVKKEDWDWLAQIGGAGTIPISVNPFKIA
mmetsp:Transcript_32704/g.44921  ORF Transcript_32704/g.44921 Transcript_32704/m.44921 type:complete len:152 (-) Transcript_32704:64-519(-)